MSIVFDNQKIEREINKNLPFYHFSSELNSPLVRDILIWPDRRLHEISEPVKQFNNSLQQLIADMIITMKQNNGVGLSAPQINIFQRIVVLEIDPLQSPTYFINPVILDSSSEMYQWEEGCLSVPGYFESRKRSQEILVSTNLLSGEQTQVQLGGLYSFALQHEIDHLNGKVFVDDLSEMKKDRVRKKITKTLKRGK